MASFTYYFRLVLYTGTLLAVSFLAVFIGLVATIAGQRLNTNYYVARTFWHIAGPLIGWKFEVEGEEYLWNLEGEGLGAQGGEQGVGRTAEKGRSAVMVGNHQSFVDILYIGRIIPKHAAIMAKKELRLIPGLGWFMMLSGTVFINRSNNKSAVASLHQAGEEMKRRRISLWIFPEGTRNSGPKPELLPFKKGAFYLAVQAGVPIIPMVCQNYHHLFDSKTYFRSGTIRLRVLPPIPTTNLTDSDVPKLMEDTRNLMLAALQELSLPDTPNPDSQETPLLRDSTSPTRGTAYQSIPDEEAVEEQVSETVAAGGAQGKYAIAMVSDFFLPIVGGIEGHIYSLGVELIRRGHRVIVITHHHPSRIGIRHLAPSLKVYHLPILPIASSATLPNFLLFLPLLRSILLRERIQIVHGHGSLSSLAHEAMYHAPLLGIKTVLTDHSLFGFADAVGVLTNKLLAGALRNVDGVICVSHTGRENTVLRAELEPQLVSVIPNALVAEQFRPILKPASPYRGDGPKMVELLQMREKYQLQDRIELLGSIPPSEVHDVLSRGDIYLSTSLTEAFGISILEAASSGLFVVATKVGGVPEILPNDMIEFARVDQDDVTRALKKAIMTIKSDQHDPWRNHTMVKDMYSWAKVAERTEKVYARAMATPEKDTAERLRRVLGLGPFFGPILCIILAVQHWFFYFLEWRNPRDEVDCVDDHWSHERFVKGCERERKTQ